jgi:molybdopterin converting factor small subunit
VARVKFNASTKRYTGGEAEIEIEAKNVLQLFRKLGKHYPALEPYLEDGFAVIIDGEVFQDALLEPIPTDAEVHLMPKIEGG